MTADVFSVPIFFIVFRETIEAGIVISVLLAFVEQLVMGTDFSQNGEVLAPGEESRRAQRLIKRMRFQIWAGTATGMFIALTIGGAFIGLFYTKLQDLWTSTEAIWEGIFDIIAALIILTMGTAFLRMDRSRAKWRAKLGASFAATDHMAHTDEGLFKNFWSTLFSRKKKNVDLESDLNAADKAEGSGGKWALFLLPMITVLREGLECVIFVAGVSIGQTATSTPLAVVVGLIAGVIVGLLIYRGGSAFALHLFLIVSTCILFLVGAGLFSKGVAFLEVSKFVIKAGADVLESGSGPGSYDVTDGNIWHVNYGNPELNTNDNGGWQIFNAILGWSNNGDYGSVLSYIFYWLTVVVVLIYLKWQEGRVVFFGIKSKTLKEREAEKARVATESLHSDEAPSAEKKAEETEESVPSPSHVFTD